MTLPTPAQIRAARAMLGWSMVDLARAAHLSVSTIKRAEAGPSTAAPVSVGMMQDALEAEGIVFLPDEGIGPGVRHRRPPG